MGKVEIGDTVIVKIRNDRLDRRYVVTNVARVWITVRPEGEMRAGRDRRFRLDNQTDGCPDAMARFYTLDQWADVQRKNEAWAFLRDQGVDVRRDGPWWGREIDLADLIRKAIES